MSIDPERGIHQAQFEESVRTALIRQEEAIADLLRAAALYVQLSMMPSAAHQEKHTRGLPVAESLADALSIATRIAESLSELQRLTQGIARDLGVLRLSVPASRSLPTDSPPRSVRYSPAEKAPPPWSASPKP
ncbi:hypothetical protein [Cohnella sp. 56]|uniref:hypothetical protein n=1 Tax=Cohnella sp. 56 TaxID=3113722 RepID=UPI0030E7990B